MHGPSRWRWRFWRNTTDQITETQAARMAARQLFARQADWNRWYPDFAHELEILEPKLRG